MLFVLTASMLPAPGKIFLYEKNKMNLLAENVLEIFRSHSVQIPAANYSIYFLFRSFRVMKPKFQPAGNSVLLT